VQGFYNDAIERRGLVPDFSKASPAFHAGYTFAGAETAGCLMAKRAGAVSKDQLHIGRGLHYSGNLGSQIVQSFRARSIWTGLVSDQGPTEFKENQHEKNVARSLVDVKQV